MLLKASQQDNFGGEASNWGANEWGNGGRQNGEMAARFQDMMQMFNKRMEREETWEGGPQGGWGYNEGGGGDNWGYNEGYGDNWGYNEGYGDNNWGGGGDQWGNEGGGPHHPEWDANSRNWHGADGPDNWNNSNQWGQSGSSSGPNAPQPSNWGNKPSSGGPKPLMSLDPSWLAPAGEKLEKSESGPSKLNSSDDQRTKDSNNTNKKGAAGKTPDKAAEGKGEKVDMENLKNSVSEWIKR